MAAAQTADPIQEDAPHTQPDGAPTTTPMPKPDLDQLDKTPLGDQTMADFMGNLQGAIGLTKNKFDAVLLVEGAFAPIEHSIATKFLPALLDKSIEGVAAIRDILALLVKFGGLGIPDLTETPEHCFASSKEGTQLLQDSLTVTGLNFCVSSFKSEASQVCRKVKGTWMGVLKGKFTAVQAASGALCQKGRPM
jgi:hypothetical protein